MKIYFVASPRLVVQEPDLYRKIHRHLAKNNVMLSDKLIKWTDKKTVEDIYSEGPKKMASDYEQVMSSLKKADVLMMEISGHSVSMGFLASKALDLCKPVIAICKKGTKLVFLRGIRDPKFKLMEYSDKDIEKVLDLAVEEAKKVVDVRFNFFVSSGILNYLDWVAQNKKIPRSVFLRELIEKEIRKDKEFRG